MLYTALSRCRKAEGLYLLGFRPTALKANIKGQREIERIRSNSLVTKGHPRTDFPIDYPKNEYDLICLQNVRSIRMHKPDLLNDPIIMASDVICLTETCLPNSEWQGWSEFEDFFIHQQCRHDAYDEFELATRKSGGVAILSKSELIPTCIADISNLEMISCTTSLSSFDAISITTIYKDHAMHKLSFEAKMQKIFELKANSNSIIVGDFNYNMMEDKTLIKMAEAKGFKPLIDEATTFNNTLLDQVFINFEIPNLNVLNLPSYYSDHNLIVICIPK